VIVLLVIGGLIAVGGVFGVTGPDDGDWIFPLLIIGGVIFWQGRHHGRPHGPHTYPRGAWFGPPPPPPPPVWPGAPMPPAPQAPDAPPAPSAFWAATATTPTATAPLPPQSGDVPSWAAVTPEPAPPKPPREKSALGSITFSVLLLALGVAVMLDTVNAIDLSAQAALAGALVIIGSGLVVGAWFGRARGLIVLGLVVTLALSAVASIGVPLEGGSGQRDWHPVAAEELQESYRLGAGEAVLDLTTSPVRETPHDVEVSVGMGELRVIVPEGVAVKVRGRVSLGELVLFGEMQDGGGLDMTRSDVNPTLTIDARVGLGELKVEREAS
jgi:hypothetical protein